MESFLRSKKRKNVASYIYPAPRTDLLDLVPFGPNLEQPHFTLASAHALSQSYLQKERDW